jgi:hypothetical protein
MKKNENLMNENHGLFGNLSEIRMIWPKLNVLNMLSNKEF